MRRALFIGRFQPFHQGHLDALEQIRAKGVIIGVGSSQYAGTAENPWNYEQRKKIIKRGLQHFKRPYKIFPIPDIKDDNKWVAHVEKIVGKFDVVYTGNDWVERLFKEKGYKVKKIKIRKKISGTIIRKINKLKKEKQAVILVHNYQWPEIYEAADFLGDSLELSQAAAKTKAKIIVFCGVDFMAESAKILNPKKVVLIPEPQAKCPMAAMVTVEGLRELKKKHPRAAVVCYINTSAAVKAECDICCTSANAIKIINSLKEKEIIFVPDKHLAAYVQTQTKKKIIPWPGYCYVHSKILSESLRKAKKEHPRAEVVVHPECPLSVIKLADAVRSTSGMLYYAQQSKAKEIIVVTEMGMIERLKREVPDKKFYTIGGPCLQQKKNSLAKVYQALKKEQYKVDVPEKIRKRAAQSLQRMLKISKQP